MTVIGIDPSFTACGVSDGEQHIVVQTRPNDEQDAVANLRRRSLEIVKAIAEFIAGRYCHVFIEGAMQTSRDAMHLYELGWLMNDLHNKLPMVSGHAVPSSQVVVATVREVHLATLRKWATGNGNTAKDNMKLVVYKRFGVEFERDPGCDKLFAYLLSRYGAALLAGEIEEIKTKRRGKGERAQQIARKASAA